MGGAALSICKGDAICNPLLMFSFVVLIVGFGSAVAGNLDDFTNMIIHGYYFSGKEGTPQGFVFLNHLLSLDFEGSQVPFKIKDEIEFYCGELG